MYNVWSRCRLNKVTSPVREVCEGRRHKRILFSKQNSKISRVSCVPKPSQSKTRGLSLARSLVSGSHVRLSHSKLILKSVYPESEYAYCHLGVGNVVPVASMGTRWPDYHRVQIPTIVTNTFDCGLGCALNSRTSVVSLVILIYKDVYRA